MCDAKKEATGCNMPTMPLTTNTSSPPNLTEILQIHSSPPPVLPPLAKSTISSSLLPDSSRERGPAQVTGSSTSHHLAAATQHFCDDCTNRTLKSTEKETTECYNYMPTLRRGKPFESSDNVLEQKQSLLPTQDGTTSGLQNDGYEVAISSKRKISNARGRSRLISTNLHNSTRRRHDSNLHNNILLLIKKHINNSNNNKTENDNNDAYESGGKQNGAPSPMASCSTVVSMMPLPYNSSSYGVCLPPSLITRVPESAFSDGTPSTHAQPYSGLFKLAPQCLNNNNNDSNSNNGLDSTVFHQFNNRCNNPTMSGPPDGYYYDRVDASHSASDSAALLCGSAAASIPPPYCAETTSRHYYETGGSACGSLISASRLAAFQQQHQQLMHNHNSPSPMNVNSNGSATMGRLAFPPPPTAPPPPPNTATQCGGSGYFRHHHPPPPPPPLGSPRLCAATASSCASDAAKSSKTLNNSCSAESSSGDDSAVAYTTSALFSASGGGRGANECSGKSCRKQCKNGPLTLSRHRPKSLLSTLFLFLIILLAFAAFYYVLRKRNNDEEEYGDDFLYYKNANDGILYGNWTPGGNGGGSGGTAMATMPTQFRVGELVQADLPPRRIVYTKFLVAENAQLLLNVSVASSTKLVLYARQTLAPTPSVHDFQRIIDADRLHHRQHNGPGRPERRSTVIHHFTVAGVWYLGFLNDDQKPQPIVFSAALAAPSSTVSLAVDGSSSTDDTSECRFNCFGKGACRTGVCHCYPGYSGKFCEETSCPALCNGNGVFSSGKCVCHAGFRGAECELSASWCSPSDCNYHGRCSTQPDSTNDAGGVACECEAGWTGPTCAEPACKPSADCSGYGICRNSQCYCTNGRYGGACEKFVVESQGSLCSSLTVSNSTAEEDDVALPTARNYDIGQDEDDTGGGTVTTTLTTTYGRSGAGRSRPLLPTPMSAAPLPPVRPTEEDLSGKCVPGCELHGTCKRRNAHHRRHHSKGGAAAEMESDEFVCECDRGWNGENCFYEGCPRNCSGGSGVCAWRLDPASAFDGASASVSSSWQCVCDSSHFGETCQYSRESTCDDGLDNDNDGLTDCEDSECCRAAACAANPLCLSVPIDGGGNNLSLVAAGSGSDFYARIRFLFTGDAANSDSNAVVQRYADDTLFDMKRISVLRGRVLSSLGGPLTGVRVSDAENPQLGFTTSRSGAALNADESGVFDLAVNGGTTVKLLFIRQPYGRVERSYFVGRNEILNVGDIFIDRPKAPSTTKDYLPSCQQQQQKNNKNERDKLLLGAFPKMYTGNNKDADPAVPDSLPGLFSIFDRRSKLDQMTQNRINLVLLDAKRPPPANLRQIRVEISVAGRLYRQQLAPTAGVRYTVEWDGRNVYGGREKSTVDAKVRVAYDFVVEEAERYHSVNRRRLSSHDLLTQWREECLKLDPVSGDQ